MAVNLQAYGQYGVRLSGENYGKGSIETPINISITGCTYEATFTIANGANTVIYSNSLTSFNYGFVVSDYNTRILITASDSNSLNLNLLGSGITGQFGLPLQLGGSATVNAATVINALQVFNVSGNAATVYIALFK